MKPLIAAIGPLLAAWTALAAAGEPVSFTSPGFPPTQMDAQGRLVEDWGAVGLRLSGEGVVDGPVAVEAVRLEGNVPAARAASERGAVKLAWTAWRAPAFPSGVDVLAVRLEDAKGQGAKAVLALELPAGAKTALSTAVLENRVVLAVPRETLVAQERRPWGYATETGALPGWAKPSVPCDPAFANIRVGMGGRPIRYEFQVPAGGQANVVLGLCESHWTKAGKRPLLCRVEGAPQREIDPVKEWGQHKPGALLFRARDVDGDGRLEASVHAVPGAADRNTILNAVWVFPAGPPPALPKVIAGELNAAATYVVDAGGAKDQGVYLAENLAFPVVLPPGGVKELTFYLACPQGSAPADSAAWTPAALFRAAQNVWKEWPGP